MNSFLITALTLLLSTSAFACPNLAGSYQLVDDSTQMTIRIVQDQCKTLTFAYHYSASGQTMGKIYQTDGKRYQTYADSSLLVYETASLSNTELLNTVEDYDRQKNQTLTSITHFGLDQAGNLYGEYDYYDYNGKLYHQETPKFTRIAE